jgi:hypothetical protein
MAKDAHATAINVKPLVQGQMSITVAGVTPLIVHRFDEKAKGMMLDKMQGKKQAGREVRDPEDDFNRSRYILDEKNDGFPAVAFKAAMVGAATYYPDLTKVLLKQALFVVGEGPDQLVRLNGRPEMREDTVRVGMGTTDLRYRAMYYPWTAGLDIRFIASAITADTVAALVAAAGLGGVGEWRPSAPKSATGSYGTFEVAA